MTVYTKCDINSLFFCKNREGYIAVSSMWVVQIVMIIKIHQIKMKFSLKK